MQQKSWSRLPAARTRPRLERGDCAALCQRAGEM